MIRLANNWRSLVAILLSICLCLFALLADSYRDKYQAAKSLAKTQQETINDMQRRQQSVAALDAKYTKELADAQATINQLHDDVASGKRRLQLNVTCTKQSATGTAGMDDAASPRLTDAAQRDYFTLRERIETITKQLTGLQAYVHEQYMK
ncbi:lysis protein [Candidatus Pantoea alvi]|uniref:lysis protein n=1 Tax=Enterobacter agglomerans TaxID=549 RepID=UPI000CDE2566|nr:lysis protein [Pantoea alvi]